MKVLDSVLTLALWCSWCAASFGQAGSLDPGWGTDGVVLTDFSSERAYGQSVLIQPDGRVVVVGTNWLGALSSDIAIARYFSDGTLDASFGSGGRVTSAGGGWSPPCYGALQSDGKIVVAGTHTSAFSAMRFMADGSVDISFGEGGQVFTNISSFPLNENVLALVIQSDGKILLAGRTASGHDADMAVVRYLPNGALDEGFASGGIWVHAVSPLNDQIRTVRQQPDGKLVLLGSASIGTLPFPASRFALVRVTENGLLDGSFGTNGVSLIAAGTGQAGVYSGVLQTDEKILATGFSGYPALVTTIRCMSDGSLDETFGNGGVITTYVAQESAVGKDIVVQPDGKVLVVVECWEGTGPPHYTALMRYTPDGVLDEVFGNSGIAITSFTDRAIIPESLSLQSDGKPLVAGYSFQGMVTYFLVVRHLNDLEIGVHEINQFHPQIRVVPNPLSERLSLYFELSIPDRISLHVVDAAGRVVRSLMSNEMHTSGEHLVTYDPSGLPSGHYTLTFVGQVHAAQAPILIE